jgi:hypothetical protein
MMDGEFVGFAPRVMVVTASDSKFLPFLEGMLRSLDGVLKRPTVRLACFDIGLDAADRASLEARNVVIAKPRAHLGADAAKADPSLLSFLARPFLPEYFPGFDVYVWIDSDVWLQDETVFDTYVQGAMQCGMAITHERTNAYRFQPRLLGWTTKHFLLGYGAASAAFLLMKAHVNAGFFAIAAQAPHWAAWAACYAAAIRRTGALVPHDQFALNQALYGAAARQSLPARVLPPRFNWICDRGIPMWNDDAGAFCEPRAPYAAIGALHLAGPAKRSIYTIRRTGGGSFSTCIVQGASPDRTAASPLLTHAGGAT